MSFFSRKFKKKPVIDIDYVDRLLRLEVECKKQCYEAGLRTKEASDIHERHKWEREHSRLSKRLKEYDAAIKAAGARKHERLQAGKMACRMSNIENELVR